MNKKDLAQLIIDGEDISCIDYSHITDMSYMFVGYEKELVIPFFDTGHVTNMDRMFQGCKQLKSIPKLDTSKVVNMNDMFEGCTNLQTVPELNILNAVFLSKTFYNCPSLKTSFKNWEFGEKIIMYDFFSTPEQFIDLLGEKKSVELLIKLSKQDDFLKKAYYHIPKNKLLTIIKKTLYRFSSLD